MNNKYWIFGLALLMSFAAGRWLAPEKVRVETKIVEVEKKTDTKNTDAEKNRRKETTTTEKTNPDGSKETTTHTIEETDKSTKTNESDSVESTRTQDQTKEIERGTSKVTISALAGISLTATNTVIYGGAISKPIFGPLTVGVWGLTNNTAGCSIGLTF